MRGEKLIPVGEGDDGHESRLKVGRLKRSNVQTSQPVNSNNCCYIWVRRLADGGAGDQFVQQFDDRVRVSGVAEGGERLDGLRQVEA